MLQDAWGWSNFLNPARNGVGAMKLRGWATILCLLGTQLRGVGAIAWPLLLKLTFKSLTLHCHIFLVQTLICIFLDSMEISLSLESNHIKLATI